MIVHSKAIERALESLIKDYPNPQEGDILISPPGIIETCAPYIGRLCAEFLDGHWCWQPYSRDTEYFSSLEEINEYFACGDYVDEGETI